MLPHLRAAWSRLLLSVRSRLLFLSLAPAVAAVLLVGFVTHAYVRTQFRSEIVASLTATTHIIAQMGAVSLAFSDAIDADAVLARLTSDSSVVAAAFYETDGVLFAGYPDVSDVPATLPADDEDDSTIVVPVLVSAEDTVGYAFIRSDMRALSALTSRVRVAEVGVGLLALVVAFLLATRLHRTILGPVSVLSQTARRVTERRDFGARVALDGSDELGQLGRAFNEMLDEIERNDARLREREAYFRSLIENSTDVTTVLDAKGLILYQSPSVRAVLGRSPESIQERPLLELVHPDDCAAFAATLDDVFADPGTVESLVWRGSHANGAWRYLDAVARAHQAGDGTLVAIINARDITARREMEAEQEELAALLLQAQKMEAVGQLTGGVAHDFNNLLTVILGNLELAEEDSSDVLKPLLSAARASAERGASLTQRLLAFSRKQALQPRAVQVDQLVEGMADLLVRTLGETYTIDVWGEAGLWSCMIDPVQLENVVLNLAINARDAMPRGGRLSITCSNCADCSHVEGAVGDFVTLTVADTGTGIPEEILAKVFDPFFTTKDVGRGSGLGLSMVYGFVMQSDGGVQIQTEPGEGTSVILHLPRSLSSSRPQLEPRLRSSQPRGNGEMILVVEDDPYVQALSLALLERIGYKTLTASDAMTALDLLDAEDEIDLLFTDVALPGGMSGVELADRALSARPGLRVLYTSGYTEKALSGAGGLPQDFSLLKKPFTREELSRRVDEAMHPEAPPRAG